MGGLAGCVILVAASASTPQAAAAESSDTLSFGKGRPVPPGDVAMGQNMYDAVCWACHDRDLGGYKGPPLTGPSFYKTWQGRKADALFDLIRNTMPKDDPGMSDRAARDLVAYIVAYANRPEMSKGDKSGK
jgi:mono/diheme cytochrome c family protein